MPSVLSGIRRRNSKLPDIQIHNNDTDLRQVRKYFDCACFAMRCFLIHVSAHALGLKFSSQASPSTSIHYFTYNST